MYRRVLPLLLTAVLLLSGCAAGQKNMPQKTDEKEMTGQPSDMSGEGSMYMDTTENVIYLAGGCFWGMEQLMQSIPGVIDAESGYANGTCEADADYKTVCKGNTDFRETVRVEYDPGQVSLDALLLAYFYVIDPTVENRQGNDRGSQSGFLSISCLSYNKGSNWLTNPSLGFYVRSKDCQPSSCCSVRFKQVEPPNVGEFASHNRLNRQREKMDFRLQILGIGGM